MNVLWIILGVAVLILLYIVTTYNKLVVLRNRVKDSWAQIDVQLKRRFDLIPNLIETVKGYTKHESETLENIVKARNTFLSANTKDEAMASNSELTASLTKLFALTESYPDLKANTNFLELQTELQETEEKIAFSRQFYNDTVLTYNNKIETIPSNIVASLFKFKTDTFFQANETERENVKVKF